MAMAAPQSSGISNSSNNNNVNEIDVNGATNVCFNEAPALNNTFGSVSGYSTGSSLAENPPTNAQQMQCSSNNNSININNENNDSTVRVNYVTVVNNYYGSTVTQQDASQYAATAEAVEQVAAAATAEQPAAAAQPQASSPGQARPASTSRAADPTGSDEEEEEANVDVDADFAAFAARSPPNTPRIIVGFFNRIVSFFSNVFRRNYHKFLFSVNPRTSAAVKKLVMDCWNLQAVRRGHDATGLAHLNIEIVSIQRVLNEAVFKSYWDRRAKLIRKMHRFGRPFPAISTLTGSSGGILTTENLPDFMKRQLCLDVNEHYLFHGTVPAALRGVVTNGFNVRFSRNDSMFGKGIYTAESTTKGDQYADRRSSRASPGTVLSMVMARVLLGNVFMCDENHPSIGDSVDQKLQRPPCTRCLTDRCECREEHHHDSVIGDGQWLFREFVVYDNCSMYPEYVIRYKRIGDIAEVGSDYGDDDVADLVDVEGENVGDNVVDNGGDNNGDINVASNTGAEG